MASNSFGTIFRITTWGESHGKAIGVVIDGCPAGLELSEEDINDALALRRPGRQVFISTRKEPDLAEILSGTFEGKTTGTPISILIKNQDPDRTAYEPIKHHLRPGHAQFTYLEKYGIFDPYGGGRSSGRETACRVAAGAIAKKLLAHFEIEIVSYICSLGGIPTSPPLFEQFSEFKSQVLKSPLFCPDPSASSQMLQLLEQTKQEKDSLGAIIETQVHSLPSGLGDPIYEKLEANLAKAMLSIPATKGFEIGSGFLAAGMKGSSHNDLFYLDENKDVKTRTNNAGGTLGGISTGMPLVFKVAFKPTSSIQKTQETLTNNKEASLLELPENSRHDPCIAIRAVPVIEAMTALVLIDAILMHRCSKI